MQNDVIEMKTYEIPKDNIKVFYQKHENGYYSRQVLKLKTDNNSDYEEIEFSPITKEAYDNCPVLPSRQK